jgi:mono/diheme cytochrome c family protein
MKKSIFVMLAVLVLGVLVLAACSGSAATNGSTKRPAVPTDFASKTNPVAGNADAIAKGKETFNGICQACHGAKGLGDGPAGTSSNPKAANLQAAAAETSDGYLFWRISEGGTMAPFNSSMPAQKGILKEEQIWQVISYIKTLK